MSCTVEVLLTHNSRRYHLDEVTLCEEVIRIVPDSPHQTSTVSKQVITTEAVHLGTTLEVHHLVRQHNLNVILWFKVELRLFTPGTYLHIISVTIAIWDSHIRNVWHLEHKRLPLFHYRLERFFFTLYLGL